ncbi:hypothetical protein VTN49DRAFT_913 [Thermomyces lanuginosus]|uniref:uncharacterized protein n=1 Tax=Thermomyces lanuginosus TaxID=5541 RepID=UPI00374265FB
MGCLRLFQGERTPSASPTYHPQNRPLHPVVDFRANRLPLRIHLRLVFADFPPSPGLVGAPLLNSHPSTLETSKNPSFRLSRPTE